jgi:Domain of unknown function (DUF397)
VIIADFAEARWRKGSQSSNSGACVEVAFAPSGWRKSSRSSDTGSCVEVALNSQAVGVRDSKHPVGPILIFPAGPWSTFLHTR